MTPETLAQNHSMMVPYFKMLDKIKKINWETMLWMSKWPVIIYDWGGTKEKCFYWLETFADTTIKKLSPLKRWSTIYNMSGRVVSDIQTRAEGESLYIRYNTDANVVNDLKNDSSFEFIGEVILKINIV